PSQQLLRLARLVDGGGAAARYGSRRVRLRATDGGRAARSVATSGSGGRVRRGALWGVRLLGAPASGGARRRPGKDARLAILVREPGRLAARLRRARP